MKGRLLRLAEGVAKYRLPTGQKFYVPVFGNNARPTRVGFLRRSDAVEYRHKLSLRLARLYAAQAKMREKSRWFKWQLALASFLSKLANAALRRVDRWHPK